jgi:hypothetical protein
MKTLIKNDIRQLAENQKSLKNQRKTVHLKGERTIEPWKATLTHNANRHQLRLLYAAYHVLKGRDLSTFETKPSNKSNIVPISIYADQINKLVEKYGKEEVVCVD